MKQLQRHFPWQVHDSVSKFAKAYALGEKESAAAVNLLMNIPADIKDGLTELVRTLDHRFFMIPSMRNQHQDLS